MGKAGRRAVTKLLPHARDRFQPSIVIANGENVAGGFGLTKKLYKQLTETMGIDCVTMGNHWADKREIYQFAPEATALVLPANMGNVTEEEAGLKILETADGVRYAVINLIGRAFMHPDNRSPFEAVERLIARIPSTVKIRIVDMHAEATSEKQGMGRFLTGRASLVYGTHSHVPTADERIFGGKTGFTTDIGMTGSYDSVIGIRTDAALARMLTGERKKFEPACDDLWMCFIVADIDPATGQCARIERHRWELDRMFPEQ